MDFLNKAFAQVADLFRSMTPAARITTALLLTVVVVSLGYLFRYHGSSPDLYLMNGEQFPASHLPAMEAAFAKAGLNTYEFEGTRIRIPRGQQNAYMAALAEAGALPETYSQILDKALEGGNVFVDPRQREQLIKAAKQKQLALIIRSIKGIQNAYVMYDTEQKRGFNRESVTTASVSVTPVAGQPLADGQVLAIRTLVARAIAGLQPENVAVTDLASGRTLAGTSGTLASPLEDPYGSRKKMYEQQWKEKALEALWYVPGATVSANVELAMEMSHKKEMVKHDPKTIPWQTTEKSQTSSTESTGPAGRVGYAAQQPPNTSMSLAGSSGKGSREEQEQSETKTVNLTSGERDTVESAGLTPKRVTMSIGVPSSYFLKVWQERNPAQGGAAPKTPDQAALDQIRTEETTKIKEHIAALLPAVEGTSDSRQLVTVTVFQGITPPEIPGPTTMELMLSWLSQHWTNLGMVGLALVALLMLRSLIRMVPQTAARPAPAASTAAVEEPAAPEEAPVERQAAARLRRFQAGGPSLRDELAQVVQEDPEAAANVLRAWIGSGANK